MLGLLPPDHAALYRARSMGGAGAGGGIQLRELAGALQAALRLSLFHVENCHTQVAIVLERQSDELTKLVVGVELLPCELTWTGSDRC